MRNTQPWKRALDVLLRDHTETQVAEMLDVTDRAVRYWKRRSVAPRRDVRARIVATAEALLAVAANKGVQS